MTDRNEIQRLIDMELEAANKFHPLFHSDHEAYAVIKEELEETQDEMRACDSLLSEMWRMIRNDWGTEHHLQEMKGHAVYMIQEAIQFAAMCDKALASKK